MATYFAFFTRNSPLFLPKKRSYLTHLLKYESQFYNRTQVYMLNLFFCLKFYRIKLFRFYCPTFNLFVQIRFWSLFGRTDVTGSFLYFHIISKFLWGDA